MLMPPVRLATLVLLLLVISALLKLPCYRSSLLRSDRRRKATSAAGHRAVHLMCAVAFSNCALNQSVELQVPEPQLFGPEAPTIRSTRRRARAGLAEW